ncbi:MAG: chemotaxis protein CheW [Haloplanus sp.]
MSNDRDDRAERIQRMREGRRDDTDDEPDANQDTSADETATEPSEGDPEAETPGADATATAPGAESDSTAPDANATLDDEIASALDDIDASDAADEAVEMAADRPEVDTAAPAVGEETDDEETTSDEETISVLEFILGDERYCLDITFIEQIVERGTVTRIPNSPPFVEGVIDLRGDITTVIDPTETLATDRSDGGDLIVVFDSERIGDEWSVGWAVDGVRRVSTVSLTEVKESPVDEPWINGVVKRDEDGEFVIWTEPGELMRVDGDEAQSSNV